jgi:predicted neuraminidase
MCWRYIVRTGSKCGDHRDTRQSTGAVLRSEFIYETAPFPSCHASTIAETKKGLVAAWFGGTAESAPDVVIYVSRNEGHGWTTPYEAANGVQAPTSADSPTSAPKRYPCYNPVLFQTKAGPLLLFYKVGPGPAHWWGMMTSSQDGGRTWAKPTRLPSGVLGPIKNKPIALAGGDLLCPSSTEDQGWRVHFERTADLGKTWNVTGPVNDGKEIGAIQPSILTFGGGRIRAIGRTQQGKLFAIDSKDNGLTWGTMRLLDVPNPNSGIDAVTLKDGRFLLVYNNTPQGRTPLNVALSKDGEHWTPVLTLESEPGEYSYPAVIQTHDGMVHVTYTWKRTRIRHVVIDPSRLPAI